LTEAATRGTTARYGCARDRDRREPPPVRPRRLIADGDQYGHVDIVSIAAPGTRLRGTEDFPPIGSIVEGSALGYTERDVQLRLRLGP
jgi:hypothetical protein